MARRKQTRRQLESAQLQFQIPMVADQVSTRDYYNDRYEVDKQR